MSLNDFLQEVHAKQYKGLDDDMPDDFIEWESCLTPKERYEYQEEYERKNYDR